MRYAFISDLHANLEALEAVLSAIDESSIDQAVCLGDVVGYNANPNECIAFIRERNIPTICGNHDAVACGLEEPWGFNPIALAAALWTRDHLEPDNIQWLKKLPVNLSFEHFLAAHGSPTDRDCYIFNWEDVLPHFPYVAEQNRTLCFFGHTHCPGIFSSDGMYAVDAHSRFLFCPETASREEKQAVFHLETGRKIFFINSGSVGQPRDGDPRAAFGILDTEACSYELVRVSYPIQQAAERIIAAGLPSFLAERLFLGR